MSAWILLVVCLTAGLFALKLIYLITISWALPTTGGALFTSTSSKRIQVFLEAVSMNSQDLFIDLGCGDGRVLRTATKRYGVRALGFEVNLLAYVMARVLCFGLRGVEIKWGNFWKENLNNGDVIFCYLFPDVMRSLARKLEVELRPGSKVISCNFPLPDWEPLDVLYPDSGPHADPIYIYRIPDSCAQQ